MLNGVLVINKDRNMTSADVVYHLRKILRIKKMGHAGTLDPEVTGVLPIAIGQATKLIELMHTKPKEYIGTGIFGYATDSYDITGKKIKEKRMDVPFSSQKIQAAMHNLTGKIIQEPPIYSAVKVNGKHLYDYARAGIEVQRPKREVKVFKYNLLNQPKFDQIKCQESFDFKIVCSKGTYVRSLINDLGEIMDQPAVMSELKRTSSSGFSLNQAVKLSEIEAHPEEAANLIQSIDTFFKDYKKIDLNAEQWLKVKNGAKINLEISAKKVALRYNKKIKAIYKMTDIGYQPSLMLLAND